MSDAGRREAISLQVEARVENLETVQAFVEQVLERAGCPMRVMMQLSVAVEEVYVNIAHYAYAPQTGTALVRLWVQDEPRCVQIQFEDSGKRFNPLEKPDADITAPAGEREIGGLGILMTKKMMDEVTYAYALGKNVLTICKRF